MKTLCLKSLKTELSASKLRDVILKIRKSYEKELSDNNILIAEKILEIAELKAKLAKMVLN